MGVRVEFRQQSVVEVRRRTEGGDAPGWQGATSKNIGNAAYLLDSGDPHI
jgi:hypothetical protein